LRETCKCTLYLDDERFRDYEVTLENSLESKKTTEKRLEDIPRCYKLDTNTVFSKKIVEFLKCLERSEQIATIQARTALSPPTSLLYHSRLSIHLVILEEFGTKFRASDCQPSPVTIDRSSN
jgi:hypothetical protein